MEYAIRQSAAIALEGVEVHFLCKPSFPVERLAGGISVEILKSGKADTLKNVTGLLGKLLRVWGMIAELRSLAKQVAVLATKLSQTSSIRNPLPATRHRPGSAEVAVLFACYKEYFAPFWVGPLRKLARRGVVIGTIAHDPVRDFVVGPLWWHRWSVRLGYSFVRHVFVHDDTPLDFGGERPAGIEVHQIPHGLYEVAEPKIGRIEMRRRLRFSSDLTTIERQGGREKEQPKVGPKGEEAGVTESKDTESTEVEAGPCLDRPSVTAFSNPSTSELLRDSENTSLTRSASGPSSSLGLGYSLPVTALKALAFDAGRWTLDASSPATSHSALATPAPPDVVFLAFGQIRDGKNLDLFLRAMTRLPDYVKLLVAGKGDSGSSRPPEFYQKLAEELRVAERCRWDIRRIPDEEVGDFFAAGDVVLVTYSKKFRSASGVLNAAVSARKPALASSGSGPLKTVVEKYQLGVFIEPDNPEEILRGVQLILNFFPSYATRNQPFATSALLNPAWERYEQENSWSKNAVNILEKLI